MGIVLRPGPVKRPQEAVVWPHTKSLRLQRFVRAPAARRGFVGIARLVAAFGAIVRVTKPQANFPDSALPVARC
jgi:hypothetical protein